MWTDQHSDRLARIEQDIAHIKRALESMRMAKHDTDVLVINEIHRSSETVKAAIAQWAKEILDLTQKLADAVANSDASDDPDVAAAVAELKASNDVLAAKLAPPVQQA